MKNLPKKKMAIAYSGCGFLAPGHGGSTYALMEAGAEIGFVAGTSGGSILAAAVGAGFDADKIKQISTEVSFAGLLDFNPFSMMLGKGYCSGSALERFLHGIFGDITFAEAFIPVKMVSTNLATGKPFIFSKETTPDCPLYLGCRCSASIPFIYDAMHYDGVTLVDGGEAMNLPAQLLPKEYDRLALVLTSNAPNDISTLVGRAAANLNNLMTGSMSALINLAKADHTQVVTTIVNDISFLDDDMTLADHVRLFDKGMASVKNVKVG